MISLLQIRPDLTQLLVLLRHCLLSICKFFGHIKFELGKLMRLVFHLFLERLLILAYLGDVLFKILNLRLPHAYRLADLILLLLLLLVVKQLLLQVVHLLAVLLLYVLLLLGVRGFTEGRLFLGVDLAHVHLGLVDLTLVLLLHHVDPLRLHLLHVALDCSQDLLFLLQLMSANVFNIIGEEFIIGTLVVAVINYRCSLRSDRRLGKGVMSG